jgi:hypothetical protein
MDTPTQSHQGGLKQIPMTQIQNPNDEPAPIPGILNTGRSDFAKRCDMPLDNVLVIEYSNLEIICNLVFEIWDFILL